MNYKEIEKHLKQLQGKVLTVIDASYPEGRQCEAVKSLINIEFSKKMLETFDLKKSEEKGRS